MQAMYAHLDMLSTNYCIKSSLKKYTKQNFKKSDGKNKNCAIIWKMKMLFSYSIHETGFYLV